MEKIQEGKCEGGRGERMLLLEFCSIRKWTPEALLKLHRDYFIGHELDGEPTGIAGLGVCETRHDKAHMYVLLEDSNSKSVQKHIPETFITPSDPKYKSLWTCLARSQKNYWEFLKRCIQGSSDPGFISFLNDLLKQTRDQPTFFTPYEPRHFSENLRLKYMNKEQRTLLKWNPILRFVEKHSIIEDAIDQEIINTFLAHQGEVFSKVRRCSNLECQRYFIAKKPKHISGNNFCCDKCRFDHNNKMKKETGYRNAYLKKNRIKGVYIKAKARAH